MDPTTLAILVAVVIVDTIIILFVLRKKLAQRQRVQTMVAEAAEKEGWRSIQTTEARRIYHLEGRIEPDITWHLVAQRSGKKHSSFSKKQHTTWRTEDVRLEEKVIAIGPGNRLATPDVDMGNSLIQLSLQRVFGLETASDLTKVKVVDSGDPNFSHHFMLLSNDAELARRFIQDPIPSILLDWHSEDMPFPGILIGSKGMRVRFGKMVDDIDTIRKIVALCGALALRGKDVTRKQVWS